MLLGQSADVQEVGRNLSQTFVSRVSPDMAIVTELSIGNPFVGQQFSVVYRLRTQHPPTAVDIDPQQYAGFWAELVPISQGSSSARRPRGEPGAVDYLLRQVVAFPLREGPLQLPPLSLKIKTSNHVSPQSDDWDVVCASSPVTVRVSAIPPAPRPGPGLPLVGSVEGNMSWQGEGRSALVLDIQGTASIAWFRPLEWLRAPEGVTFHERLAGVENTPQTIEVEGSRRLSLIQRQRWTISVSGSHPEQRIDDLVLPVFEPGKKIWMNARIAGITIPYPARSAHALETGSANASSQVGAHHQLFLVPRVDLVVGLAAIAGGLALFAWLRTRRRRSQGAEEICAALEKRLRTSPKAFLDSAHKLLEQYAEKAGRAHNLGLEDALLDRCWTAVQRYRFSREPLPSTARDDILRSIEQLTRAPLGGE
jgi:hypothetical protein